MSPEAETYLRISLALPFLLLGVFVYAIVRRYRGLPIPTWAKCSIALLLGFSLSPAYVFFVREPLLVIMPSLPVLWVAFILGRSGRFRLAGLVILGMTLPGALWWGRFVVEDQFDPLDLYTSALWWWWFPAVVGVVMAVGLIFIGDHAGTGPRVMKRPRNAARDPMALGNALSKALAFGPYPLPSVAAELVAFVVTVPAVGAATALGAPWPLAVLGGAVAYCLIATELWYVAFPRHLRGAWEAFAYVGHIEMERFRASCGTPVPNTEAKFHAWLRDNPERPETRWAHAELLAVVGRTEEARSIAERIPTSTPSEEFSRRLTLDYIDWIEGAEVDLGARVREADEIGADGSDERRLARGLAVWALARDRADAGADWKKPLEDFRRDIGGIGWEWIRQDSHRQRLLNTFALGLVVSILASLPWMLFSR